MTTQFKKLTRDKEENTTIAMGHVSMSPHQLEQEIKSGSDMGRKLEEIAEKLEEEY